jgi:hypothetical protein
MAFADWHIALADAASGDGAGLAARVQRMEELASAGRYAEAFGPDYLNELRGDWPA